jgi:hypothetical protein
LLLGAGYGETGYGQGRRFAAKLRGSEVVSPMPGTSAARARAVFRFDSGFESLRFTLKILDGRRITGARLHCAPRGVSGPAVADLLGAVAGGLNGTIGIRAGLTNANIIPGVDCAATIGSNILNLADLAAALENKAIYVEVSSQANPEGEIRGQVEAVVARYPDGASPTARAAINQAIIAQTTAHSALTQASLAQADAARGDALAFASAAQATAQAALAYTQAVLAGQAAAAALEQAKNQGPEARQAARAAADITAVALSLASQAQIAAQAAEALASQPFPPLGGMGGGNGIPPGVSPGIGDFANGLDNGLINPLPELP